MSDVASVVQRTHGLLEQIFNDTVDPANEYQAWQFSYGTVPIVVRVVDREDHGVVVYVGSPIVSDVAKSPDLLDVLNTMNANMFFAHAYWSEGDEGVGDVYAATNLLGESLDRGELEKAMRTVGEWADKLDEAFAERFGARGGPPPPPPGVVAGM